MINKLFYNDKFVKIVAFFALFFLAPPLYAIAKPLEKITLQLQWRHQFEFAGYYAAKEKGFYSDAGLDVEFVEFDGKEDIVQKVLQSDATYGTAYSSLINEYLNGKPLVMIANFFKQSPMVLVAQENIKTLADLKNKKIMGLSDNIHAITLFSMLDKFGVHSDKIIHVPTTFSTQDFIDKKVDAMSIFTTNELYYLNKSGIKYTLFDPAVYATKYYDNNLFTTKNELHKHPQRVEEFRLASIRGWQYALTHQEEIIALIRKKYNTQNKSVDALRFEAKQIEYIMLPTVYPVGSIDSFRVRAIADDFIQSGFVKRRDEYHLNSFIYHPYLFTLTPKEIDYLRKKDKILFCVDPNWMPFEMIKDGKYIGFASEYIDYISQQLNITFELLPTQSWDESLERAKKRECDIISLAGKTPMREKYMDFTTPYIEAPLVIVTKIGVPYIANIEQVKEKRFGIVKSYSIHETLKHKYPSLNIVEVDSLLDGLARVEKGELFGYIDNSIVTNDIIQNEYTGILQITGRLNEVLALGIATRNDEKLLHSIFEKTLLSMDKQSINNFRKKWISTNYASKTDYKFFYQLLLFIAGLFLLILYRHHLLQKSNKLLEARVTKAVEDIRQRDILLQKQSHLVQMGEMIAMIAHQWRQPLTALSSIVSGIEIKFRLNLYKLDTKDEVNEFKKQLNSKLLLMQESIGVMSETINDFRSFYKKDKQSTDISINTIVKKALKIIEPIIMEKNIVITQKLTSTKTIHLYQNEIMQVILNLIKNAEDALQEQDQRAKERGEEPSIKKIEIVSYDRSDGIELRIGDNADGIPDAIVDKIFDPYFSTKQEKNGTGLGLYMSKMIIEDHHKGSLKFLREGDKSYFVILLREVPMPMN